MNNLRTAAQQALEALMWHDETVRTRGDNEAIAALRAALAQQEQEPVAWQGVHDKTDLYYRKPVQGDVRPLYTHPPRAEPEPPPEPISDAKIRAEFRDLDRHTLPGEMTVEDWFEAGVRFAERQHEIV